MWKKLDSKDFETHRALLDPLDAKQSIAPDAKIATKLNLLLKILADWDDWRYTWSISE